MKKALSIILCLAMIMSTVPVSVFAAPSAVTIGDMATYVPEVSELPEEQENDSEEAELAAEGTVSPVKVLPANGETVDRRYPVAYYTFGKSVVIDADDVTVENIGNAKVDGVYFDEETNTIWVFPADPMATVYATNKVSYEAWTSNIEAADGSLLYFPGVNFNLATELPSDGKNLLPFGNMEYGWTPFDMAEAGNEGCFHVVEDPTNPDNMVTLRTWNVGKGKYPHAQADVAWKPGTKYKATAKVMVKDFMNDSGMGGNNATNDIIPDIIYTVPSFSCVGTNGRNQHDGQTGTVCTQCGKDVDREHPTSFKDHPLWDNAAVVTVTGGVNNGWQTIEIEFTTRDNLEVDKVRAFSLFAEPVSGLATEFYIDDVEIYEEVSVSYAAGKNSALIGSSDQRAQKGYNGETITLARNAGANASGKSPKYASTKEGYVINGWTDGVNVYAPQAEYVINGAVTLTPNVVPEGDSYEVTFTVDEEFESCYAGPAKSTIAAGEALDLSADEYKLSAKAGYYALGWKNAATGEFVTSVSGTANQKIELVAVFAEKTSVVVDIAAKVGAFDLPTASGEFDATVPGLKVTPADNDPYVIFGGLDIDTNKYSGVNVTYAADNALAASEVYFIATGMTGFGVNGKINGVKASEENNLVTYYYDFSANEAWVGTCSDIRIDPFNSNSAFTIAAVEFVENEAVEAVSVTGLTAPVIAETPDFEAEALAGAVYSVESVEWDLEDEYFAGSTAYTATVRVKINESGYMFADDAVVTLDGEAVDAIVDSKVITIKKTFPATAAPAPVDIVLTCASAITVNDGTIALSAVVNPVNAGDVINPGTVTWELTGGEEIATLEGNVLTAKWNGTAYVTATPAYDVTQTKTFEIAISNQVGFTVSFDKNTGAEVNGMPESVRAKREYQLPSNVPTREGGFVFDGWTLSPDGGETVSSVRVTKDVTLYAKWAKGGYKMDFNNPVDRLESSEFRVYAADGNKFETSGANHTTSMALNAEDSELEMLLGGTVGNDFYMTLTGGSVTALPLEGVRGIEYSFRTDAKGSFGITLYYATKDADGNWIAPDHPTGGQTFIDNRIPSLSWPVDGNPATQHTYVVDTTVREPFKGYLNLARLDIENSDGFKNKTIWLDYVKLLGAESVEGIELEIDAPEASAEVYNLSSVSTSSEKFVVKSIKWEGADLVDGKYYAESSAYAAKVEIEAAKGYALSDAPAYVTVNGEDATLVNEDGKTYVYYTFPATEDLIDIQLQVKVADDAAAEITTSLGTLQLEKAIRFDPSLGVVPSSEVYWSIDASQKKYGWVDENGLVTGNTDCEALVVTATSKYNPSVKATITIKVSGQIPEKLITFAAGTGEAVTNLPAPTYAKDEYELPFDVIPVRSGYAFKGWSKVLGGPVIKVDDVKKDTTYYAVWGYSQGEEFNGSMMFGTVSTMSTTFENGVVTLVPNNEKINEGVTIQKEDVTFKVGRKNIRLAADDIEYIEIKTNLAPENLELCMYVQPGDANGNPIGGFAEANNTRFYSHTNTISSKPDQSIFKYCEQQGDWYVYKLPVALNSFWHDYLYRIRFNIIKRDMEEDGYGWLPFASDETIKIDYIRFVGKDIPAMDVAGISVPTVKGEATTEVTPTQSEAFKITDVKWEPALLGGIFFGSNTEYKVTLTAESLKGYNAFSNPPARVTINGNTAEYKRVNSTTATITYTFPATENVGNLQLVDITLVEATDDGVATETKQIFSGDDFDLNKFVPANEPTGFRWIGWSETAGGEPITGSVNVTAPTSYYAVYDIITEFDFSVKSHQSTKNVSAKNATLKFDGAWAVVTPESKNSASNLVLSGMTLPAADFDYVEVIYDGSLEDKENDNKFGVDFAPVLKVNGSNVVALASAEAVIASNKVAYKYTYDLTANGKPELIENVVLAPYSGFPAWAVTSIKFVPNAEIEESAVVTGVDAPITWNTPDVSAETSGKYVFESIVWSAENGFNSNGSFKADTAYTAAITLKPATGYKIKNTTVTVDGEVLEGTIDASGYLTVNKTFAATERLVEFTLSVADAEITEADGTVTLAPVFTAVVPGETVPVTTVKWEIVENGPDGKSATINSKGVVKAAFNGNVVVKATSDYNPEISATATVVITNQIESYAVTFDANTTSTVSGMPSDTRIKFDYTLPKAAPVREGFSFAGWVKSPSDTVSITKDYITKDTTYYALWVKGLHLEFFDGEVVGTHAAKVNETYDYEEGTYSFELTGTDPQIYLNSTSMNPGTPWNGPGLFKGDDYRVLEIRMKTEKNVFFHHGMYFESVDEGGNVLGPSYAIDPTRYVANFNRQQYATGPDDYTVLRFDMSEKSDWVDGYPTVLRIDLPDDGTAASLGFKYTVDYIRVVNYETSDFAITGIDTPVAKAVADKDAVSKDPSKYVVTNVAWEGGLLHDYYFGSNTAYTVAVTIKGAPGYFVSDVPSSTTTINGKPITGYTYNSATGELTLKLSFPATGTIDNEAAHDLVFVAKNDNGMDVSETRTIFEGDVFEVGSYQPISTPSGKRWIGWSEDAEATENTVEDSFVVDSARTFYAVYEDLTQFDYSNYYHTFGTTAKAGSLSFENGLAIVSPDTGKSEPSLMTPALNINGKDFAFVEVYYSSFLTSRHDGYKYDNLFSATLQPSLKFSTMDAPASYSYSGKLVDTERVTIGKKSYQKYTYDMTTAPEWYGKVGGFNLQPYAGYPIWGVGFIKLIPNTTISDTAVIELAAPEVWATPDIADNVVINDKYEVVGIKWTPAVDTFKANADYSVTVTYKPLAGYVVDSAAATINGAEAEVKSIGNNTYTATVDFDTTAGLKDVEVVITGKNEITGRGRYLDLKGVTLAVDGSEIPVTDVTWSVKSKGTSLELATISENGRVYPISNGTVVVTAKSVYNPSVSATHEIAISNQADLVTVTFDKNTFADVTGMPAPVKVYGSFVPETYDIHRDGFFFTGWSVDEDAEGPDASFNITEDTVLYAKWGAGYDWSFNDDSTSIPKNWNRTVTYKNGIATIAPASDTPDQVIAARGSIATALALETAKHQNIEIRLSTPVSTYVKFYLQSATADGSTKSVWSEDARMGSLTDAKIPANAPGQFQVVNMNLKSHKTWNVYPYVEQIRLDLPELGPTQEAVQIDYIRLLTNERSVKFEANGGLIPLYGGQVTTFKETYTVGKINLPADPVREGYEFLGWAKDPENYNKLYNNKFPVTDDHILYAIWTPAAVLDEETVTADDADVTVNENGTVTVTSTEETTPVVAVADTMEVGDNQTVIVKLNANYASTTDAGTALLFTDEAGEPHTVIIKSGALSGKTTITVDLSEAGFEGTVTDVSLVLPSGVISSLTIESVVFTTADYATSMSGDGAKKDTATDPDADVDVAGKTEKLPTHGKQPAGNGGAVTEFGSTSSTTPKNKKVNVPKRPADDAPIVEKEPTGTTTPSTGSSKFALTKTYDGRFTDVTKSNWFYADVEKSYRLGLMNGKSDATFVPDGTVTLAEAITVAARMHAIYNGTTVPAAKSGEAWFQPYVTYATTKAIITNGQYSDYNALATREQVAVIFVRALPSGWYNAQNLFNTIPDVPASSASFAAIQRLYNAGVVTGVDDKYNFKPGENIKRSELSAIINRVALKESRLRVVTEDEKNSKNVKVDAKWLLDNATVGNCVEKTFTEKDGLAWAMPSKNDPIVNDLQNIVGGTIDADEYKTITVVVKPDKATAVPVGHQAKIYYSSPTVELSEANNVRVGWTKVGADGTVTLTFKMSTNPSWKGEITFARFDPFDLVEGFSVESITFAP